MSVDAPCRVVIPLKSLDAAKSRLNLPPAHRREAMIAFARDVMAACHAYPVTVVADADWRDHVTPDEFVTDPGAGLNEAIRAGLRSATGSGVLVIMGDLPCLTPGDVDVARRTPGPWFVTDLAGTGTTALGGLSDHLQPCFGPRSARSHRAQGYAEITRWQTLRRDVDTTEDLAAALEFGVGPHTTGLMARTMSSPLDEEAGPPWG